MKTLIFPFERTKRWPTIVAVVVCVALFLLLATFRPADDYEIYTHFAEAVADGQNPYALPDSYRSTVIQKFSSVGPTQPEAGWVKQVYADYPPALMLINAATFKLAEVKGLYLLYVGLFITSILIFFFRKAVAIDGKIFDYRLVIFLAFNPLLIQSWFFPISDKAWFLFFIALIVALREYLFVLTVVLAAFAATKGLGIVIFRFMYFICTDGKKSSSAK